MGVISFGTQAKIIASLEIASSVIGFMFVSLCTLIVSKYPEVANKTDDDPDNLITIFLHFSTPGKVTSVAVPIIYFVGEFILAVFLYRAVIYRNYHHLRIWYIVTVTICMTALYFFLPGVFFTEDSYYFIGIFIASYVFTAYSVWVVHLFMEEMKRDGLHMPVAAWEEDMDKL